LPCFIAVMNMLISLLPVLWRESKKKTKDGVYVMTLRFWHAKKRRRDLDLKRCSRTAWSTISCRRIRYSSVSTRSTRWWRWIWPTSPDTARPDDSARSSSVRSPTWKISAGFVSEVVQKWRNTIYKGKNNFLPPSSRFVTLLWTRSNMTSQTFNLLPPCSQ